MIIWEQDNFLSTRSAVSREGFGRTNLPTEGVYQQASNAGGL
jgi:hypothetical protein